MQFRLVNSPGLAKNALIRLTRASASRQSIVLATNCLYNPRPSVPSVEPNYIHAKVAELVDALDLGSSIARCESSSLSFRTIYFARLLMFDDKNR